MTEAITSRLVWLGKDGSFTEAIVGNTLSKLPEDIREWAVEKLVWFCPPKDVNGQAASLWLDQVKIKRFAEARPCEGGVSALNMRVVYVAPHVFVERTEDECRHIITHEIAHHWLGHSPGSPEDSVAKEEEADECAHRWLNTLPQNSNKRK
jgi:hypothetical protein